MHAASLLPTSKNHTLVRDISTAAVLTASGLSRSSLLSATHPAHKLERGILIILVLAFHALLLMGLMHLPHKPSPLAQPMPLEVALIMEQVAQTVPAPPSPPITQPATPIPPRPAVSKSQPKPPVPKPVRPVEPATPIREEIAPAANTPATPAESSPAPVPSATSAPATSAHDTAPASLPVTLPSYNADYLNNPKPNYPSISMRLGEEGRVLLRVLVSEEGTPIDIQQIQSSGSERLDNAAREAVKRWRFIPARQGENKVKAWVQVPIDFKL